MRQEFGRNGSSLATFTERCRITGAGGRGGASTYRGGHGSRTDSVSPKPRDIRATPLQRPTPRDPSCENRYASSPVISFSGRNSLATEHHRGQADSFDADKSTSDMEQGGVSIITPTVITENSVGKSKSIGITFSSRPSLQAAKEKLKTPWLSNLMKEDTTGCETLMSAIAELVGTAILVFIGCTGCIGSLGVLPSVLQLSLTFGLAVLIAIQCVGHISGAHINPCISVAAMILGTKSLPMTVVYIVSQCIGALVGYGLLRLITPVELVFATTPETASNFCTTQVNDKLSTVQGFIAEALATGILVLFACGLWDHRNTKNSDSAPIRFGLCVAVLCIVFIPYTGCSLNPARTLGPAVWNGNWNKHWVYWLGPMFGTLVASLMYRCLFFDKRTEFGANGNLRGVET
ncbi:aquaporin AQPcic-like [Nomia melanderi]|uniref:aquaporin AQPcic-like n=1 Tax=Nomia melanderi TaxID=2448451 RepID=UPI001304341D|nr:aquaporin AQPcic-like [Nomia melanderi]